MIRIPVKLSYRKEGFCEIIFRGLGKYKECYYCLQQTESVLHAQRMGRTSPRVVLFSATPPPWNEADCHLKVGVRLYIFDKRRHLLALYEQHRSTGDDEYYCKLIYGEEFNP